MLNNIILNQDRNEFVSNQVIIKFNPKINKKTIKSYHSRINAVIVEENDFLGFQVISSTKPVSEMLEYYKGLKGTEYVRPNYSVHIT